MTNESKRDWGNLLTEKDFYEEERSDTGYTANCLLSPRGAAKIANEIIRKELEKAPVVRGECENHTHTAKLICIEEIKRG